MKLSSFCAGLAVIAGLGVWGCSGTPTMPSSTAGATIQGVVNPSSSIQSVRGVSGSSMPRAGLTVSVAGTGISTVTDSQGRFVLSGLPGGSVTLQFQGSGVNATLTLSGLESGQTLTITVRVSGSDAEVEPGDVSSPSPSPSSSPTPSPSASPTPSPSTSPTPSPTPSPSTSPSPTECFAVGGEAEVQGAITVVGTSTITVHEAGGNEQDGRKSKKGTKRHKADDDNEGAPQDFLVNVTSTTKISNGETQVTLTSLVVGSQVDVSGTGAGLVAGVCTVNANRIEVQGGNEGGD